MKQKPVLSIGIIFKNEIRCLERCVKSLQSLRDALPCELVMADTGSDDGSREVAEKYADILFDFPWINDFAAARNAVMDRCSGEWYFSIDADEWLDENIEQLVNFFIHGGKDKWEVCGLTERNYYTYDMNGGYGTFMPWRLLRMATGMRYKGAIHETWDIPKLRNLVLTKTVLHHDGYVSMNGTSAEGREKRERNMVLLRKKLEDKPEDLLAHLQFIESGRLEPDFIEKLRKAISLVEKRVPTWNALGASIFRYAINFGKEKKLPELEEWLHTAEELFISSYFIRMDAAFNATVYYLEKENFEEAVRWGEICLLAHEDFNAGRGDFSCQIYGSVQSSTPLNEAALKIVLSRAYFEVGRIDDALALVGGLDYTLLDAQWTKNLLESLHMFYFRGETGPAALISKVWEDIQEPAPNEEWADKRKASFLRTGAARFGSKYMKHEPEKLDFQCHIYKLYIPLKGKCVLGTAAAILESSLPSEMEELLYTVEDWKELPVSALAHALQAGVKFPLPGRVLAVEEMDGLASRLSREQEDLRAILGSAAVNGIDAGNWQSLTWARSLVLAAVRTCKWEDEAKDLALARTFAKVEQVFVAAYYAPELLREENICVLPLMHRFGWYCGRAFDAVETGDPVGFARLLREGLEACPQMKEMVEFLVDHTPALQEPPPDPELAALANQVRTMLARFDPDDPAVAALKASPVYQRVARFVEGAVPLNPVRTGSETSVEGVFMARTPYLPC